MTNPSHSCHNKKRRPQSGCHNCEQPKTDVLYLGSLSVVLCLFMLELFFSEQVAAYTWLTIMTDAVYHMLHAIWWGVVIGIVFIGLLSKVPREFIAAILGQGGTFSGLLRATAAGVLLDLCSHGILMVAVKLYERGASAGQVVAFLLASPWNSLSLTLILIGLIGLKWTLLYIVLSMLIALITGWLFDGLVVRNTLPKNPHACALPENFDFFSEAKQGISQTNFTFDFYKKVIVSGLQDSRMVLRWLLFGIVLAALLKAVLSHSQFEYLFGPSVMGLAMTLIVATVIEVCSEGSAPIAADISTRAKAPGNGFAFLMAGVATDYTEVMVLKDTTRSWKFALFLPLLTVPQVLVIAWILNHTL